jgi:DNA transformation protein and related proteins
MATQPATIEALSVSLGDDAFTFKKMFGEYAVYKDEKVVALVCDDRLFVKPSSAEEGRCDRCSAEPPYPGSKPYWMVPQDLWVDREWLVAWLDETASVVPAPKKRKK